MQTNYNEFQAQAVPGLVANQESATRITRVVQGAAGLGFGVAAFRGTASNQVVATPAAGKFVGITIADITQAEDKYPQFANAGLVLRGVIWVKNGAAAVAHGDAVYVTPAGLFTNVTEGNVAIPDATFETSAAANGNVAVRIK